MNRRRIVKGDETWLMSSCSQCPFNRTSAGRQYCQKKRRDLDDTEDFPDWCPADKLAGAVQ